MSNFLNFAGNSGVTFKNHGTGGGTSFTLDKSASTNSVLLSIGGIIQKPVTDYSISGTAITTTSSVTSGVEVFSLIIHDAGNAPVIEDNSVNEAKLLVSNSPTNGQFLSAQSGDAGGLTWAAAGGGMQSMQVFTSSGTWTKPSGITKVKVTVVGGGGGAGACQSVSTYNPGSAGGGGGGTAIEFIDVSSTSSETVTVGAGGAGGAAGTNNGAAGGTSSFGSFCSATGGGGGEYGADTAWSNVHDGGAGGAGSGGDVNIDGQTGGDANSASAGTYTRMGDGGGSFMGPGAAKPSYNMSSGIDAAVFGGGGSGVDKSNEPGGDGHAGIVIVEEYK